MGLFNRHKPKHVKPKARHAAPNNDYCGLSDFCGHVIIEENRKLLKGHCNDSSCPNYIYKCRKTHKGS
jgi:hypothetical protein